MVFFLCVSYAEMRLNCYIFISNFISTFINDKFSAPNTELIFFLISKWISHISHIKASGNWPPASFNSRSNALPTSCQTFVGWELTSG